MKITYTLPKLLLLLAAFGFTTSLMGQSGYDVSGPNMVLSRAVTTPPATRVVPGADQSPFAQPQLPMINPGDMPEAMFDVQFRYSWIDSSSFQSHAGIVWTGTEFWISKWNGPDTLLRYNATGQYLGVRRIVGLGPVRALTSDGTHIYAADNSKTIKKVNIATQALVGTFSVPASVPVAAQGVRWITFNPTGNGGLGSFYVGNFGTDIVQVSNPAVGGTAMVLSTITAAAHGLTGMYGAAYDGTSTGGPYIWVYNQANPAGGTSQSVIVQVQLPGGNRTGVTHDVNNSFAAGGLAGGISIAQIPGQTQRSLLVVDQGTGLWGGLELNFVLTSTRDAGADSVGTSYGHSAWPLSQNSQFLALGKVTNFGNQTVTAAAVKVDLIDANLTQLSTANSAAVAPAIGGRANFSAGPFTAPALVDDYFVRAIYSVTGDANASNDTTVTAFAITDSTMARDFARYGFQVGGLGIGAAANEDKKLGQIFQISRAATLTSISAFLPDPAVGQPISYSVYSVNAQGVIGAMPVANTRVHTITAANQGALLTLSLLNGPLSLPAGEFLISVNELGDSTASVGTTSRIYVPGKQLVRWNAGTGGNWTDVGAFGANFRRAFVIRPNFGANCAGSTLAVSATATQACFGQTNGSATAVATGGSGVVNYAWSNGPNTPSINNVAPGMYSVTVTDGQGCRSTASVSVAQSPPINATTSATNATTPTNGTATVANVSGGTAPYNFIWATAPPQTTATATGLAPGTYTVVVFDANGCSANFSATVGNSVSIDASDLGITNLSVYPNPTRGQVVIELQLAQAEDINLSLTDTQGRVVFSSGNQRTALFEKTLDLSQLPAGIYMLSVQTPKGQISQRLSVK